MKKLVVILALILGIQTTSVMALEVGNYSTYYVYIENDTILYAENDVYVQNDVNASKVIVNDCDFVVYGNLYAEEVLVLGNGSIMVYGEDTSEIIYE